MPLLLSADHVRALTDSQTWVDNPFAARDARRDQKRKQLTRTLIWMALLFLLLGGATVWGIVEIEQRYRSIPWYLGGDGLTALIIVICGTHVWFVASAAQRGTLLMFQQEASRNTLMHLLTLPASTFQIVLESAVYPWCAAMRVALTLLPVYVLAAALGAITWVDLGMLYVVFAIAAISLPVLRKPALGDSAPTTFQPTPGRQALASTAGGGQSGSQQQSSAGGVNSWIALAFLLPTISMVFAIASRRGVHGMYSALHQYLPNSLLELMPTSVLSWPLLMARGLVTPLDWFGIGLPPIILVLPLILAHRYLQAVHTAEYLQVGKYRDLADLPTFLPRRRAEAVIRAAQLVAITGYLWKWLIWNGGWGFAPGLSNVHAPGLPSFAYVVLFTAAWTVIIRASMIASWRKSEVKVFADTVYHRISLARFALYLVSPTLFASVYYGICCAFSQTAPLPHEVVVLLSQMLPLTVVAGALAFGSASVLGPVGTLVRILLPLIALFGYNSYHLAGFRSLAFLSPTMGLLSILPHPLQGMGGFFQGLSWRHWLTTGGSVGLVLTAAGLMRYGKRRAADAQAFRVLDFTRYGSEVFMDQSVAALDPALKEDTPFVVWLIAKLQHIADNAITTREIRTRLRGKLDNIALRNLAMLALVITMGMYEGIPEIANAIGGWLAALLYGPILKPVVQVIASILACWFIVLGIYCLAAGFAAVRTFSIERDKSTLGFVLLTPMSNSSIIRGKAAGILLSAGVYPIAIALWTLVMSVAITPTVGIRSLGAWALIVCSCALCYTAVGMISIALGAIAARWNVSSGCWGVAVAILSQVMVNGGRLMFGYVQDLLVSYGIQGMQLYYIWLGMCGIVIAASYALAVFFVQRMRRGDLAFAASKRDN